MTEWVSFSIQSNGHFIMSKRRETNHFRSIYIDKSYYSSINFAKLLQQKVDGLLLLFFVTPMRSSNSLFFGEFYFALLLGPLRSNL